MLIASSFQPSPLLRRARVVCESPWLLAKHLAWVLLNGSSVGYRLWTVALGAAPVITWTLMFKRGVKLIPLDSRPPIHIDLLPWVNDMLVSPYGVIVFTIALLPLARLIYSFGLEDEKEDSSRAPNRCKAFAISIVLFPTALSLAHHLGKLPVCDGLDLWAFASYGCLHFASPIIAAWWVWGFGSQGAACIFGWCLGLQNITGLITHLMFPNAAPWFYDVYGQDAAQPNYEDYPGNPAGLVRVDRILGTHIYAKAFGKSPVVFGAVPSLHAATAICCSLFVARYSRGYRGLAFMWFYCFWMFWSTMYLHHHFAIDLAVGTFYATCAFLVASRLKLRPLDARHERNGLTSGWQRLRWNMHDGENFEGLHPGAQSPMFSSGNSSSASLENGDGRASPSAYRNGYAPLRHSSADLEEIEVSRFPSSGAGAEEKV